MKNPCLTPFTRTPRLRLDLRRLTISGSCLALLINAGGTASCAGDTPPLKTLGKRGGITFRRGFVLGVGVNVIEADLNDPGVHVSALLARGGVGTEEQFGAMVRRAHPTAAITGTFFGIQNRLPTGDLVINGRPVFRGFIGTAVAITRGNMVSFIPTRYGHGGGDWGLYETVIRGGPRLVDAGRVTMAARQEGFRTLPVTQRRTRTAVGVTADNHLQFVAVRQGITLNELAKVMGALGAYHAVALDGGTSTALYFNGKVIASPGRGLTNVLLLYDRPPSSPISAAHIEFHSNSFVPITDPEH